MKKFKIIEIPKVEISKEEIKKSVIDKIAESGDYENIIN